ncbi:MAG: hypothetical protein JSW28_03720, partial [Thermoplasmata archaeon]
VSDVLSRIVVASEDGTDYSIGVASRLDAQRHAVLNYNPMLGRIKVDSLSLYEKGFPQPLFNFPLKKDARWSFSIFNVDDFSAKVTGIRKADLPGGGSTVLVDIRASAPSGAQLTYSYDTEAQWVSSLVLEDSSENKLLEMTLVSHGQGFKGDVYFIRGVDIFDEVYSSARGSPEVEFYNSFIDQGHPNWGTFNDLIYYYNIVTGDNAGGTLTITDPASDESVRHGFGSNTVESTLGTIPSDSGEWKVQLVLTGEADLDLRIAGGIEYIWTV